MSGFDALEILKADVRSKHIPIVMFSSSDVPKEVARTFKLGANSFIKKPINFSEFRVAVKSIADYWLRFNLAISHNDIAKS
jgi:hypothetical protein